MPCRCRFLPRPEAQQRCAGGRRRSGGSGLSDWSHCWMLNWWRKQNNQKWCSDILGGVAAVKWSRKRDQRSRGLPTSPAAELRHIIWSAGDKNTKLTGRRWQKARCSSLSYAKCVNNDVKLLFDALNALKLKRLNGDTCWSECKYI